MESSVKKFIFGHHIDTTEKKIYNSKMFEQSFKNIDDILWKDAGCSTELDYAEQSSWILFLKWLDDYDKDKQTKSKLETILAAITHDDIFWVYLKPSFTFNF